MCRAFVLAVVTSSVVALPAVAQRRVRVVVKDVVGTRAYLTPGRDRGIRPGTRIRFRRRRFRVVDATSSYAVVELGRRTVQVGARGIAIRRRTRAGSSAEEGLEPVTELAAFSGQWPTLPRPASAQRPGYVPLTIATGERVARLILQSSTAGIVPLRGGRRPLRSALRARVQVQPLRGIPLRLDADAAFQVYAADQLSSRRGADSRPIAFVRQLQLSYGEDHALFAALGRLKYASPLVGMLDGARVQSPSIAGFTAAAFGGFAPKPTNGAPSLDVFRFGAELRYRRFEHPWRPAVQVTAHASRFDGAMDERRVAASATLMPGTTHLNAYAEMAFFDQDNPWGLEATQLMAAGLTVGSRSGPLHWSVRADYRRPERSRWLAANLPPGYLCVAAAEENVSEACAANSDARISGQARAELRFEMLAVSIGGHYAQREVAEVRNGGGYVNLRVRDLFGGSGRLDITGSLALGSFVRSYAARVSIGASLMDGKLDLSARYRPSIRDYIADVRFGLDHLVGAAAVVHIGGTWLVSANVDTLLGRDTNALLAQLHLGWNMEFHRDRPGGG